jgi:hypothetical protein
MPNRRFEETGVSCWFCVREDAWAFPGEGPSLADHYGYVRVSGILIPACEPCARGLARLAAKAFDFGVWRREAFSQHALSCKHLSIRHVGVTES